MLGHSGWAHCGGGVLRGPTSSLLHCSVLLLSSDCLPPFPSCPPQDSDASVPDMDTILVSLHLVPTSHCNLNSKVRVAVALAVAG